MSPLESVLDAAQTNSSFRDQLVANPSTVLRDRGCELPEGKKVECIDAQPGEIHVRLGVKAASPQVQALVDRATADAAFRQQLLANPKSAFEGAMGQTLPAGVSIIVHQPDPQCVRLLLPPLRSEDAELSNAELETVAGGGAIKNFLNFFCNKTGTSVMVNTGNFGEHQWTRTTTVDGSIGPAGTTQETVWI